MKRIVSTLLLVGLTAATVEAQALAPAEVSETRIVEAPEQNPDLKQKIAELESQLEAARRERDTYRALTDRINAGPSENIASRPTKEGVEAIDTLPSGDDAVRVVLYNDDTWRYIRSRRAVRQSDVFTRNWDTTRLFAYNIPLAQLPHAVAIDLVDSVSGFHYPYKTRVWSKYGPRGRRRQHQGVDLSLKTGDAIYAAFGGRVRLSTYNGGGYGNMIIVRHENGLETTYAHLSERIVHAGDWVEAGQIIGYGGSTGRSTGPHLHFETRYCGQTFDPEWIIDFERGTLRRETFLLKRSYFNIHASAVQNFDDEDGEPDTVTAAAPAKPATKPAAKTVSRGNTFHKIKSGDTLSAIARKYNTNVAAICKLNGMKSTETLKLGRSIRVK